MDQSCVPVFVCYKEEVEGEGVREGKEKITVRRKKKRCAGVSLHFKVQSVRVCDQCLGSYSSGRRGDWRTTRALATSLRTSVWHFNVLSTYNQCPLKFQLLQVDSGGRFHLFKPL